MEQAKAMGAMALFGEKYGDAVRVIKFGDSVELCGGTHAPRTGEIGSLRIVSEGALAAGIRRLEAITSEGAEKFVQHRLDTLDALQDLLKHPADITQAVKHLLEHNAAMAKEIEKAAQERVARLQATMLANALEVNGARVVAEEVDLDANGMRDLAFRLKDAHPDLFLVLGARKEGKALLAVMVGADLIAKGITAPKAIKELAAEIKGGGGGQPFYATAGGKDPDGLPKALKKAISLLA